ncbi:MAG: endonuclease VIII [Anaerolineae bacterium]|nr:endonuclease VIII [Anaerolineae bacterium]
MIEIPEAIHLAEQLNQTVRGKGIARAVAAQNPHKFAWYQGDPQAYPALLTGRMVGEARGFGTTVEFRAGDALVAVSEGATWHYHADRSDIPAKHQLLLEFGDGSALSLTVRMYGGILCFREGEAENPYYLAARDALSPLSDDFNWDTFQKLLVSPEIGKLSAKAFLATEQRIPGLGNGCLQDILYNAKIHPKRKMGTLDEKQREVLYQSMKSTLAEMTARGGRDTEPDLFGNPGGYHSLCSKNTVGQPCGRCGSLISKEAYMGGSVYFCPVCQPLL